MTGKLIWNDIRQNKLLSFVTLVFMTVTCITQVSGGQLQRACICRSMINHPEILFADEPTGALNKSAAAEDLLKQKMVWKSNGRKR